MGLDVTQLRMIEGTLSEIEARLRSAVPSPAVRELRVRHGALARVVQSWAHVQPHEAQIAAMLECVLELRTLIVRTCGQVEAPASRGRGSKPSGRPSLKPMQVRTTRPPPRAAAARTTRPPPRRPHESGPPSSRGN